MNTEKYRPVLAAESITHICNLCRKDASQESLRVLSQLASFEFKVRAGAITPAYALKNKISLSEDLGFSAPVPDKILKSDEQLYNEWLIDPSTLSHIELTRVRAYRYQNNKMTVDEEAIYEAEILGPTS
jgi:hypothetical protein